MDFNFMFNESTMIFITAFVVFFGWQIAKLANPKWFYPIDENQKKRVAEIITTVNTGIGVVVAIFLGAFGLSTNFWDSLIGVLAIMGSGSVFDVLKAYGVVK
jgi:hypothetical protein